MYRFNYSPAQSVDEAVSRLEQDAEAKIIAGGMTLLPTMKMRLAAPSELIDLGQIESMREIQVGDNEVVIGATAKHAMVAAHAGMAAKIPALCSLANGIGDAQVRNRGTIGGSVANNDPAADYPAAVLGLGATVITNQREIAGDAFFEDMFETALSEHEIITAVNFPVPDFACYQKFPNPASRYAIVGVFLARFGDSVRVAVTGAGACVFRFSAAEAALEERFQAAALDNIVYPADDLNEDMHASAEYRAHLVSVLTRRALDGN